MTSHKAFHRCPLCEWRVPSFPGPWDDHPIHAHWDEAGHPRRHSSDGTKQVRYLLELDTVTRQTHRAAGEFLAGMGEPVED